MRGLSVDLAVRWVLIIMALAALGYAAYIALAFAEQPLLDAHSFRQTQTALTSYWFIQEGFQWAYQTPVAGVPWSIPFEFPLYQAVVAIVAQAFDVSLDAAGRVSSFLFLLACLIPAYAVIKKLALPQTVFWIFAALMMSSPLYIYWGRTFMIETAALFLTVAAIKYAVDVILDGPSWRNVALYVLFMTLSLLQKSTTGLPVHAVMWLLMAISFMRSAGGLAGIIRYRSMVVAIALAAFVPVLIGGAWVFFTDYAKSFNPLGSQLTSAALSGWNWGTLFQRVSSGLWEGVLWGRLINPNLAGYLGLFFLVLPFVMKVNPRVRGIIGVSFIMGVLPMLLFTNLHLVHDYYQSANLIYFVFAVAVSLGVVVPATLSALVVPMALLLMVASNYSSFAEGYRPIAAAKIDYAYRDFAVGKLLQRNLPGEGQFVAFGNDWSSSLAYFSERKSFTAPVWFKEYAVALTNPEKFVDQGRLHAVVWCGDARSHGYDYLLNNVEAKVWSFGETHDCLIALQRNKPFQGEISTSERCHGYVDAAEHRTHQGRSLVSIKGWAVMPGDNEDEARREISRYIALYRDGQETLFLPAMSVPRPDVSAHLGVSQEYFAGFSSVAASGLQPGSYRIGLVKENGARSSACEFDTHIFIEASR